MKTIIAIVVIFWPLAALLSLAFIAGAKKINEKYDADTEQFTREVSARKSRPFAVLLLIGAAMFASDAKAQAWRSGDHLMLNVRSTIACDMAPLAREWHRILEDGRPADAFRFAITYCRKMVWAPVPLIVMYEDDFTGEPGPAVCVRQINWRDCEWIAREYLTDFDPGATSAPTGFVRKRPVPTD